MLPNDDLVKSYTFKFVSAFQFKLLLMFNTFLAFCSVLHLDSSSAILFMRVWLNTTLTTSRSINGDCIDRECIYTCMCRPIHGDCVKCDCIYTWRLPAPGIDVVAVYRHSHG